MLHLQARRLLQHSGAFAELTTGHFNFELAAKNVRGPKNCCLRRTDAISYLLALILIKNRSNTCYLCQASSLACMPACIAAARNLQDSLTKAPQQPTANLHQVLMSNTVQRDKRSKAYRIVVIKEGSILHVFSLLLAAILTNIEMPSCVPQPA